jgi:hypothetical protein
MGMGGFTLQEHGYTMFPIVLGAEFEYWLSSPSEYHNAFMNPEHFEFKTLYEIENVHPGQTLRTKAQEGESDKLTTKRSISENEIKDRSKGDALGKTIVLFQLTWFLVQIIARAIQHLHITPLEITTVAYIIVSGVLYGIWWKKPKDIRYPIGITLAPGHHQTVYRNVVNPDYEDPNGYRGSSFRSHPIDKHKDFLLTSFDEFFHITSSHAVPAFYSGASSTWSEKARSSSRIGMPYAAAKGYYVAITTEVILGCAFGVIHCSAWSFDFHTHTEQLLWRASSLVIVTVPIAMSFISPTLVIPKSDDTPGIFLVAILSYLGLTVGVMVYIIARLLLLALACSSLRNLPPDSLRVVSWTSIIPHFG